MLWGQVQNIVAQPYESPLLYSLLQEQFEIKPQRMSKIERGIRKVSALVLAIGCGIVGSTVIDHYLGEHATHHNGWAFWLLQKFGSTLQHPVAPKISSTDTGIAVQAGVRLRTPREIASLANGAVDKAMGVVQPKKTIFKPLCCCITVGAYFVIDALLTISPRPFYTCLVSFVKNWQQHKIRTPQEFHSFFDRLHTLYRKDHDLLISEEVAMTVIRQITMVCSSKIKQDLGVNESDANYRYFTLEREMIMQEKEYAWLGWQMLPTLCTILSYFFS